MAIPFALLAGLGLSAVQGMMANRKAKQTASGTANTTSNSTTTRSGTQTSNQTSGQQRRFNENPLFGDARENLLALLGGEFDKAQKPVYGKAQQASFMQQLNELSNSAMQRMTQNVSGVGGLNSGRFAGGVGALEQARMGEASKFFQGLPFQEEQARSGRVNNLLGLATNWLGTGPVDEDITGESSGTTTSNETSNTTGSSNQTSNQTQTQDNGEGGWQGALRNLIGFGGGVLGDFQSGKGGRWGFGWGQKGARGGAGNPLTVGGPGYPKWGVRPGAPFTSGVGGAFGEDWG